MLEKLARLMYGLFKGRRDTWGVRRGNQYFRVTGKELTVDDYVGHLQGTTIGIYPLLEEQQSCYLATMDVDVTNEKLARTVSELVPQPNYIEKSRSGHYHIWMFFKNPVLAESLALACNAVLTKLKQQAVGHCQLYPLYATGVGLLIALPFQRKFVEQGLTVFIDAEANLEAQYNFLSKPRYTKAPGSFLDDTKLKALWEGKGKTSGDTSQSGYDFSFVVGLLKYGYTHDAAQTVLARRPGLHKDNPEYLKRTVDAAFDIVARKKEPNVAVTQPVKDWASLEAIPRDVFLQRIGKRLVLYKEQIQQFDIFFATIMANLRTKGRPVWILFVGPPGCGKTLPMMALRYAPQIHMVSAFRPAALISGWGMRGGEDVSLVPKLNNKILMVKDLSSLLSQHKEIVGEVLGLLRDIYDGSCSKVFGTGVERTYTSRFGFIGATTPDIDAHWSLNVRLGERFLRYRCRTLPEQLYEKIERSLSSLDEEEAADLEIEDACLSFLKHLTQPIEEAKENGEPPKLRLSNATVIGRLAQLGAILRTVVSRAPFGHEVLVIPEWEEGTRYAKQLAKMALGLACVRGKETNGPEEMEDLKTLIRDAMDARVEKICQAIYKEPGQEASTIAEHLCLPTWTVRSVLDDLAVARVVYHQRNDYRLRWFLVPWIEGQIKQFDLWTR